MKKFKEKFMAGLLCGAMLFSQMMLPQLVQAETVVSVNAVSGNLLSASTVNQEPGEQPALSQNSVTLSENTVSLSAAQKNFIDAVSALDKEKLIRLAIVFMLAGSEESRAAFTVEYEKVEAADSLYGLLSAEGTEHEQVRAGYAVLEALVQEINAVLYPVPQADAAYEAGTMSLIEQAALGAPGSSRSGGMAVFAMPNG